MKNTSSNDDDQPKKLVELDQETIADLEVDDLDADRLRGGASGSGGGNASVRGGAGSKEGSGGLVM